MRIHPFPISTRGDHSRSAGSALLVTLLVVSLLLVLVITFVTVVRMELRKVISHQELLQARSHARLGLEMAIAKLQESAGPDTRVTAPHLGGSSDRPNTLHIAQSLHSDPFVQGNSLQINPLYGQTAAYLISHDRADTNFDPADYWPFAGGGDVTTGNVLLVGPGSVLEDLDENDDGVPDGYVAAPLRPIEGQQNQEIGQYAYWIRDEGLKAQINLTDSFRLESGGRLDLREQATTAQRVGSESLLPGYDPDSMVHTSFLNRTLSGRQLDLTPFVGEGGAREFFHDITLQSLGLPVNVKTGGFKRDLTPVIQEAEANGGQVPDNGTQWLALLDFQEARMQRWRDQTVALETGMRPAGLPDHRWNALNAITLREDQNQPIGRHANQLNDPQDAPELREKIFPPMSDLDIRWDPGGASWRQLLSFPTMKQRLSNSSGQLFAGQVSEREKNMTPVVARFAMSYYFTWDWPTLRLHSIPLIVLWNPYNEPLRVPANHHWQYKWQFQTNHFDGFGVRFQFRNPSWRSGEEIWTPRYMVGADTWGFGGGFRFRLLDENGNSNVVIPPGEALFFTMNRHMELETSISTNYREDWGWRDLFVTRGERIENTESNIIDLYAGLHGFGGYSFYIEHGNFNERLLNQIARGPRILHNGTPRPNWWPGPNGNWNAWDEAGFPFAIYIDPETGEEPDGIFTPNDELFENGEPMNLPVTHGSDYPVTFANNSVYGSLRNIAINEVGLDPGRGWELTDAQMDLGRADFRSRGMYLTPIPNDNPTLDPNRNPWVTIPWPYMRMPSGFTDGFTPLGQPIPGFDESQPLNESYPQFPTWGTVWGLRMPDPVIHQFGQFGAPSRWLIDYNPTAPFQIADPVGRTRSETHRGGYNNPASYMGGFSQFPGEFSAAELTYNERNQAIGLSDDFAAMRFPSLMSIPRLVLFDVPEGSDDMVSMASFQHASPHSIAHAWAWRLNRHNPNPTSLEPRWFASEHDTGAAPGTDYAPSSPTYPIGNSFASVLVPRDRSQKSYYPAPMAPEESPEPIPYAQGRFPNGGDYGTGGNASISYFPGYDTSYIYNKVLWDDFFLTPDSNRLLQWRDATPERDFNTSASRVKISGAFNVNSTSVAAWTALLASMLDVEISNQTGANESSSEERAPFSRFLNPVTNSFSPDSGDFFEDSTAYSGFRRLSLVEIEALAEEIVEQVKLRGPFLSLADFVNRQLVAADDDGDELGLSGALQTAIHLAGLNHAMGRPSDDIWMEASDFQGSWRDAPAHSAFYGMHLENAEGPRTAGSPGYLMQADILARIGSLLQARSDTFTIRTYGALGSDDVTHSRAWLEATVQRMPEYIDDFDEETLLGNNPEDLPEELSQLNRRFGRRFRITSFRWLTEDEI
ncbi:MAG: hypothetical protein JJU29_13550 [Verrucomicrobia bacterium]|nr:hypothetical protein [Verrucomicrobiota bacterium]MCH8513814.1 hypothetical protein [Kiritimatiellia bacterium]